jgi:hypothetical protein
MNTEDTTSNKALQSVKNISSNPSAKTAIIIFLLAILILFILGINVFSVLGNFIQTVFNVFMPQINHLFSFLGYATGTVVHNTADVAGDTAKVGVNLAEGTTHSIGNILSSGKIPITEMPLENKINEGFHGKKRIAEPTPDNSNGPIQNPITSAKTQWSLLDENKTKYGYVDLLKNDMIISGQIVPSQKTFLNPAQQ